MIGKIVRMLVGRSLARSRGFSGAAGIVAGLVAPVLIKRGAGMLAKGAGAARQKRRERRAPKYLDRIR